jgi:hypothetical protein
MFLGHNPSILDWPKNLGGSQTRGRNKLKHAGGANYHPRICVKPPEAKLVKI